MCDGRHKAARDRVDTKSALQRAADLREFRYLAIDARASVSSTREPMKPKFRPNSEQGLASAVNLAGPLITSSP